MQSIEHTLKNYRQRWWDLWLKRHSGFFYEKDASGNLTFVSPEATQMLGWSAEEIQRQWPQWFQEGSEAQNGNIPFALRRLGPGLELYRVQIPDVYGKRHLVELLEQPLKRQTGTPACKEGMALDMSEAKQREDLFRNRENQFRELIDFSPVGIFQTDADGKFTYVNTYWQVITRSTLKETLGYPWWSPIHPEDQERICREWQVRLKENRECFMQCRILRPDGETRWVELRSRFLLQEGGPLTFGTLEDITERKVMESQLEDYARELIRSNNDLENFAAIASHDLQEPLRKIITFSERLQSSFASQDREHSLEYLERIRNAGSRMRRFIEDLLQFSRVTSKAQPFEWVDLKPLMQEVISDLEVRILKTGAAVTVEDLPSLKADPLQMRQLFQNLIGNALKFQRPGVPPEVFITARQPGDGGWEIEIRDNGVGFDEKYLDRIFKPFERLHGRSEYEGSGMGLAICKKIVERHGGTLSARSRPGAGASFIIHLPVKP